MVKDGWMIMRPRPRVMPETEIGLPMRVAVPPDCPTIAIALAEFATEIVPMLVRVAPLGRVKVTGAPAPSSARVPPKLTVTLAMSTFALAVTVWPLAMITVSHAAGTTPLGHGAFGVVLLQLPEPAEVITVPTVALLPRLVFAVSAFTRFLA